MAVLDKWPLRLRIDLPIRVGCISSGIELSIGRSKYRIENQLCVTRRNKGVYSLSTREFEVIFYRTWGCAVRLYAGMFYFLSIV